ncbi:MAG TPA: hypothetical protein VGM09_14155 [Bradyrhizobium sp.]|jgi:hypothetical protein
MSSESEQFSANPEPDGDGAGTSVPRRRSLRLALAYVLFVIILGIWVASPLLSYSHPIFSYELVWAYLACLLALFLLFCASRASWFETRGFATLLTVGVNLIGSELKELAQVSERRRLFGIL